MRVLVVLMFAAALLLAGSAPLHAQAWDAPSFLPPGASDDVGVYGVRPQFGDWGVVGIWRQSGDLDLGVRAGYLNLDGEENAVVVGSEFYGPLLTARRGSPLEVAWVLGVGATFDEGILFRVPAGITVGARLDPGGLVFVPYAHPRVGLEILADEGESVTEISFLGDVGLDLHLGRSAILRFGYTINFAADDDTRTDDNAFGAGAAIRIGRRVVAR